MSSLKRTCATLSLFGALLLPRAAAAETNDDHFTTHLKGWDASLRSGYGSVFTVGISYLGVGWGGTVGYHVTRRIRIEGAALSSWGGSARASADTLTYRSSYDSVRGTLGASYDVDLGPLVLRPGIRAGVERVVGHTSVDGNSIRDERAYPLVGPCVAVLVRFGIVEVGVDGEAFFLPTWPAAPTAGLYAFAGVHF